MPAPRVAVVGGGLSGALCGLGLKAHGVLPVVFDAGRGPGGRLSSGGAQFFFAESSRFRRVVEGLRAAGLAERWQGRFGVLGGKGGFLPVETIRQATGNRPDLDSKQGCAAPCCAPYAPCAAAHCAAALVLRIHLLHRFVAGAGWPDSVFLVRSQQRLLRLPAVQRRAVRRDPLKHEPL